MADGSPKQAGEDIPVAGDDETSVIDAILACRREAEDARDPRMRQNRLNRDVFFGRQDWSHKQAGQSTEFIPKTSTSVEQLSSFVKRGLLKFGDWYSVELDKSIDNMVSGAQARAILNCFLNDLWLPNDKSIKFPTVISDCVKNALLESLMIVKVHGGISNVRRVNLKRKDVTIKDSQDELQMEETQEWKLRIDLVRTEDYYPDPTGRGLYEIHTIEKDLDEIMQSAEDGLYDKAAVKRLIDTDYEREEDEERTETERNQAEEITPGFRKRVVLDEFWGTLLKSDGTVAQRNIVCTVANKKIVIRKPEPNPFWHQESPFCVAPILRVPFSVWHRAMVDSAASLNIALNEMFNLILDGGIAAVWGIKQLRIEDLEDPGQVAGGVKQGDTLAVKQTLPHDAKVLETVTTGDVPNDAMAIYEAVNREYNEAMMTNELKLGNLPGKQVRATEVVEANQSQATTMDGIIADIEDWITTILYKSWSNVMQNADDIPATIMPSVIDKTVAVLLMRASPEERYSLFAGKTQFRVFGLSATMAKALDFQKFMALMQAISTNPLLLQQFMQDMSASKSLRFLMTRLNINPDDMQKDMQEKMNANAEVQRTMGAANLLGAAGGQRGQAAPGANAGGAPLGGQSSMPAQVNANQTPGGGMPANA